jgi:hydroxymethylglutaryl-CoA reductase
VTRKTSAVKGFHKLSVEKRLGILKDFAKLSSEDVRLLKSDSALGMKTANYMIENVIGTTQLPLGVAANFLINKKEYFVPMAVEEPSVVAAASYAAKLCRPGGFTAYSDPPLMIGQIHIMGLPKLSARIITVRIRKNKKKIIKMANEKDTTLLKLGGGLRDIETRIVKTSRGRSLIVHLIVDVRDAMGANIVNTMAETVAPYLEGLTKGKARLKIISNLAVRRMAHARAVWPKKVLGEDLIEGILDAYACAEADRYRCATHNKGIMNGIDAVAIATGNDFRALEAGAHAYASMNGYKPLTRYWKDREGNLAGEIELPVQAGLVGGATRTHPIAKISQKILRVETSRELAEVMVCVGLANNFAALRAMVLEGIQAGHMKLHARNIAVIAGAEGKMAEKVGEKIVKERNISVARAKELIRKWREKRKKEEKVRKEGFGGRLRKRLRKRKRKR